MRLFYVPGACSLASHIALRESGLNFKLDRIDLKAGRKTQAGEEYLALNPKGYVPALELDDGEIVAEGAVVLQVIADKAPASKLAPPNGTLARVRLQEWLHFIATELHKNTSPLYQKLATDEFKAWWRANKVEPRFEFLAKKLEGRAFLMGDTFTVADAYAYYMLRSWQGAALGGSIAKWPVLVDYYARLGERDSVRAALAAEAAPV